jgi:hypothetical protein
MNQAQNTFFYGLANFAQAKDLSLSVCNILGHGKHKQAVPMLLETASVETNLGTYQDPTPNGAGFGLTQADQVAVIDVAYRTRPSDVQRIKEAFNFNIRQLIASDLNNDPLKAFVFTRCFYKLIPAQFPTDLAGRAQYWKTYYNTESGKGTVQKYIRKANLYLYNGATNESL